MDKKQCPACGKVFIARSNQIYCCPKCSDQMRATIYKDTEYNLVCRVCGKSFTRKYKNTITCSKECLKLHYKETRKSKGINKTTDYETIKTLIMPKVLSLINQRKDASIQSVLNNRCIDYRNTDFSSVLRDLVLERDNYTCQICGMKLNLQVHHILPRRLGGEHAEENLVTLCCSCHRHIDTGDAEYAVNKCAKNVLKVVSNVRNTAQSNLSNKEIITAQNNYIESLFEKLTKLKEQDEGLAEILCSIDNFLENMANIIE